MRRPIRSTSRALDRAERFVRPGLALARSGPERGDQFRSLVGETDQDPAFVRRGPSAPHHALGLQLLEHAGRGGNADVRLAGKADGQVGRRGQRFGQRHLRRREPAVPFGPRAAGPSHGDEERIRRPRDLLGVDVTARREQPHKT